MNPSLSLFLNAVVVGLIVAAVLSVVWYIVSIIRNRNDVADIGWATYFVAIAIVAFLMHEPGFDLRLVPIAVVLIWGVRLSWHIAARHAASGEDKRYLAWRAAWGNGLYFRIRSFLQVFFFQAILALVISLPLVVLGTFGPAYPVWLWIGAVVWLVGFLTEKKADDDLARYLKTATSPGICQEGLWAYSRHPNYFGEAVQWWGIWIMTVGAPLWGVAVLGPLTITFLLRFVSGVPMTEKSMERLPGFEEYKRRVNVFVVWWRKE